MDEVFSYKFPDGELYVSDSSNLGNFAHPESVHLVCTSPPYNLGIDYDTYNDKRDLQEYMALMEQIFTQCYQVLVNGGRCCINIPSISMDKERENEIFERAYVPLFAYYIHMMEKIGFETRATIVWYKQNMSKNTAWGSYKSPSNPNTVPPFEYILVFHKGSKRLEGNTKPDITKKEFVTYSNALWNFKPETNKLGHPVPYPIELPYRCIRYYSYPEQIVLDPFAGVCTTALAARQTGRKFICFDMSRAYIDLGKKRLDEFKSTKAAQPNLFTEKPVFDTGRDMVYTPAEIKLF